MGPYRDYFGTIFRPFWDFFGTIFGLFLDHFGTIFGLFWDYFGTILGSFWDHLGTIFGQFWNHFRTISSTTASLVACSTLFAATALRIHGAKTAAKCSVATKLRRLALCAFINMVQLIQAI